MCVGLRYTVWVNVLFVDFVMSTSRKGRELLFSISMVKDMLGCMLLRWSRNVSRDSLLWGQIAKTSSTYRIQQEGLREAELRAVVSKSSMKMLARIGDKGEPIGAPCTCL